MSKTMKSGQKLLKKFNKLTRKAEVSGITTVEKNIVSRISHATEVKLQIIEWLLVVSAIILLSITQSNWYSESYSSSSFVSGGTFTEATLGKVSSLNPLFASTDSEYALSRLLFSSLTINDYTGHVGLGLAKSVKRDAESKKWEVALRDDIFWSDGKPITSEDVIFTTELIQNPTVSTMYSSNLSGVKITSGDNGSIIFELPSTFVDFDSALNFPILPKHILENISASELLESDFSKKPVSSGPFIFNASQSVGSLGEVIVYLTANDNYFLGKPKLDSFAIHAFLNKDSIISALNSGSVTASAALSSSDSSSLSSRNIYERESNLNSGVFAFFNTSSRLFQNPSVRSSVRKGININLIREIAGTVRPLDYPILKSQLSLKTWPELPPYSLEEATEGLKSLGVSFEQPVMLTTVNTGVLPLVAEAFADELRSLGFTVNVSVSEPNQDFLTNIVRNRAYDILIYEVELGVTPDILAYYHSSQANPSGLNLSNYNNPYADDLILASHTTSDEELRKSKYEAFLSYWIDDAPSIALYQSNLSYFYNKNTKIFSEYTSLVEPEDRFVEVEHWASEKSLLNRTP